MSSRDFSKCANNKCPSRDDCYRYRALPNPVYQGYLNFNPKGAAKKCAFFCSIGESPLMLLIPEGTIVKNLFKAKDENEN